MTPWQRISATEFRLDEVWSVRLESDGFWYAYRGDYRMLARFADVSDAQAEAERLREEDKHYT